MHQAITVSDVSVVFNSFAALDTVSLGIPKGCITGFIGPSGAGKTTLIRSIVGRQKLTQGRIEVLGEPAGSVSLRQRMSYMTQEGSVYPDITVRQCLAYFATMFGIARRTRNAEINSLLETVELQPQADQLIGSLSGGQRQRVSLAVALIGKPELMVLDEPTVGLDPVLREQIWNLFRRLANAGTSLIISSHVMDEAERCDDLVLIRDGKVLATGSPESLRSRTHSDTVEQSFLKLVGGAA